MGTAAYHSLFADTVFDGKLIVKTVENPHFHVELGQ